MSRNIYHLQGSMNKVLAPRKNEIIAARNQITAAKQQLHAAELFSSVVIQSIMLDLYRYTKLPMQAVLSCSGIKPGHSIMRTLVEGCVDIEKDQLVVPATCIVPDMTEILNTCSLAYNELGTLQAMVHETSKSWTDQNIARLAVEQSGQIGLLFQFELF